MKIAILSNGSANYTTKRLKEVAKERGHEVKTISYTKCYVAIDKDTPIIRYKGQSLDAFDAVIPRIAQSYTKYGTAVVRQFEATGAFSTASFEDVAEMAGGTPLIIKVARGTHGNGVVLAETPKAAKAVMQAFYVEGVNFLVQEFVKESAGVDIRVLVVGGRVVASVKRQSLDGDFRSNTHQGGTGVPVKLTEEERKTATKAAKAMGLPICGVDMMRSERGPLVLEVNSSASIKTPELITKRDIATKIIEYIEQNAKRAHKKDRVGA